MFAGFSTSAKSKSLLNQGISLTLLSEKSIWNMGLQRGLGVLGCAELLRTNLIREQLLFVKGSGRFVDRACLSSRKNGLASSQLPTAPPAWCQLHALLSERVSGYRVGTVDQEEKYKSGWGRLFD